MTAGDTTSTPATTRDEHVAKLLADAPPLTAAQKGVLAELLRPARQSIARNRQAIMVGRIAELDVRAGAS
jgi:hypothetical protein